jgi:signal transduction histidine kinase
VLLPTLAVLQYRWVGQVSTAERERMQRNLRNAAAQFRASFDQEVGRAFAALQVGATTARDGGSEQYSDRYDAWLDTAEFPDVVAHVFVVDAPDGTLRARRFEPTEHKFEEVAWPESLRALKPSFDQQRIDFDVEQPFGRRRPLPDDPSLLVAPLRNFRGAPAGSERPLPPPFGFTVVELDRGVIVDHVLPTLARRYFIHSEGDSYRVAVVDAANPGTVIYQSDPKAPVRAGSADTTEPFYSVRAPGFFFGRRPGGPRGDGQGPRFPGPGPDRVGLGLDQGPPPDSGRWLLAVQHVSGSLEAAVAGVRRRNLGISFGVLLLLTVSVALLAQASRRAQRLAHQQMEFVAGVSHELRTPIAVIRSAAENLSHGVVGNADRVKQYGKVMEGEARRLGEMVESVLQYAGVESGKGLGSMLPVAVDDVIDRAIDSAQRSVESGAHIERQVASDLPAVLGDNTALTSAVQNLIVNAIKYGGDARWVGVHATQVRRGRKTDVHVTVEDRGPGIPTSELPHIFEPFYRGADATSRQIHGNGLGLSLVQRIARAHGGSVSVRTGDRGTSFTIVLPAASAETRSSAVTSSARAAAH